MLFDIVAAEYVDDYKIRFSFENGRNGVVDLKGYCKKGGVFGRLKDRKFFMRFYLNKDLGTICWPNGLDIAPETLYSKLS